MGKIKTNKRLSAGRQASDPMGSKLALADEIESLKLAKTKFNDNQANSNTISVKKRHADEDEVNQTRNSRLYLFSFDASS